MLARRFTIVCLLMSLFGMAFAILVAEAGRATKPRTLGAALPCMLDENGIACPTARRR